MVAQDKLPVYINPIRVCMLLTGFIEDYHGAPISCWIFICQLVLQMVTSALPLMVVLLSDDLRV